MTTQRTHLVTTSDGVTIGATVHGQGPPLVFLSGAMGDGDLDWRALLPYLTDRFTCHLPSRRGRGLSDDHPDLSLERHFEDCIAYVESLEEQAGIVGWSGGANDALAVAARSDRVGFVLAYEPVANGLMGTDEQAALGGAVTRMGELAAEGRLGDAMRAFAGYPFTDDDIAAAGESSYFEATGRYAPNLLRFFEHLPEHKGPLPDDPAVLGAISAPVLVLHGSQTKPFLAISAEHVARHVPHARLQQLPGAGHAAPLTHPEPLARALVDFANATGTLA